MKIIDCTDADYEQALQSLYTRPACPPEIEARAQAIVDEVRQHGDAAVLSQKDRSFTVDLGHFSPVRILVPAYEYLDALQVIATHMDRRGEVVFACPTCGEAFEPGDTICATCGGQLPSRTA